MGRTEDWGERGIIIDGLYVPPIGLYGIRNFGELVWGPSVANKIGFLRTMREGSTEHLAIRETLYYRMRGN